MWVIKECFTIGSPIFSSKAFPRSISFFYHDWLIRFFFNQVIIPNSWHLYLVFFLIKWALLSGRHTWLQQGNPIAIKRHSAFMMRFSYLQIPVIVTCVSPTHLVHYKSLRLLFSLPMDFIEMNWIWSRVQTKVYSFCWFNIGLWYNISDFELRILQIIDVGRI